MAEYILHTTGMILQIVDSDYLARYSLEIASQYDLVMNYSFTSRDRILAVCSRRILIRRADHSVYFLLRSSHSLHGLLILQLFQLLVNMGLVILLERPRSSRRKIRRLL